MATFLKSHIGTDDTDEPEYISNLDEYEMSIIIEAVRRHIALQKVELEELIEGTKANAGESDWRDNPADIQGLEEMIDRAQAMLNDFKKAVM